MVREYALALTRSNQMTDYKWPVIVDFTINDDKSTVLKISSRYDESGKFHRGLEIFNPSQAVLNTLRSWQRTRHTGSTSNGARGWYAQVF